MKVDLEFVAEYNKSLTVLIPKRCRQHKKRPFCKVVRKNTTKTKIVTKTPILKLKMLLTPYILRRQHIIGTSFYHYVHILSWQRSLHHYHYFSLTYTNSFCSKLRCSGVFQGFQGIQQFHEKFVFAPADKATNSAIVV